MDSPGPARKASFGNSQDQRATIEDMSTQDIRRELAALGFDHRSLFERFELVNALKKARKDEETKMLIKELDAMDCWALNFDPEFTRAT